MGKNSLAGLKSKLNKGLISFDLERLNKYSDKEKQYLVTAVVEYIRESKHINHDILSQLVNIMKVAPKDKVFYNLTELHLAIKESEWFDGIDTYKIFSDDVVKSLSSDEVELLLGMLQKDLSENHVVKCQAILGGMGRLLPYVSLELQKNYLQVFLSFISFSSFSDLGGRIIYQMMHQVQKINRSSWIQVMESILNEKEVKVEKELLIVVLQNIYPGLNSSDRVYVADVIAPFIYNRDRKIVRTALNFFQKSMNLIPENQRFSYCLMLAGLVRDLSLLVEVEELLKSSLECLNDPYEREQIQAVVKEAQGLLNHQADEIDDRDDAFIVKQFAGGRAS